MKRLAAVANVEPPAATNLSLRTRPAIHAPLILAPRAARLACLLLALFSNPVAQAQAAPSSQLALPAGCPANPAYPLPPGTPALQDLLARLNTQAPL